MRNKYMDRAKKGAEVLDSQIGADWHTKINLSTLDLGSCYACILGQLFGEYMDGRDALRLDAAEARAHGFTLRRQEPGFLELTKAWGRLILHRLAAPFREV